MYYHASSKDELGEGSDVESFRCRNSSHTVSSYFRSSLKDDTDTMLALRRRKAALISKLHSAKY